MPASRRLAAGFVGALGLVFFGCGSARLAAEETGKLAPAPEYIMRNLAGRAGTTGLAGPRTIAPSAWKALLVGGNHLVDSYNRAASDLAARLRENGVHRVAVLHSTGSAADAAVPAARQREMRLALGALGTNAGDACLVFITSHANERGIYLSAERGYLSPRALSAMIAAECAERPTVLVLSGCGTGAFITASLTGENRIILTASARGRVAYGAATTDRHVNFDRCMIAAIDAGARTWREVFDRTLPCVGERERALGVAASQPQAWFGPQVAHLALPRARAGRTNQVSPGEQPRR